MNRHYLLYLSFYLIFLTGCATEATPKHYKSNKTAQADTFMLNGQHKKAAHLYQSLAQSKPAQHHQYNLLAAEAYVQSGDNHSAQKLISTLSSASFSPNQLNKLNFISAQIYLSNGQAEQAINKLNQTQIGLLKKEDQIIYYQSLAFAYSLTENQFLSAQSRIRLAPLLESPGERHENNIVIFNTLNSLPLHSLSTNQALTLPNDLSGWIALSKVTKTTSQNDRIALQDALNEWTQHYPQHPANLGFLEAYFGNSRQYINPSSIALLLPESGQFTQAAQAIKEGFMSAYYQNESMFQPSIRFYDTSINNPADLYQQAISEGAELIIGPLSKKNIHLLTENTELTTPVLALNHISSVAKENLFQFGLSPIDEAKQIATRAHQSGVKKILLITPATSQGNRTANTLSNYWQEIEGIIIDAQSYDPRDNDFSSPIKNLLNINESQERFTQLKRFLATDIQHTERIRQDTDAIFLSASPKISRSIYPQLRFYGATNIPVYAATQLYTGLSNPSLDRDLNKITFCDIPWLFPEAYSGNLNQESLREVWQQFPNKYLRLVALGIDSFNLISHLNHLSTTPYLGATGRLSLNIENRVTRQLVCSKFIKGQASLQQPLYEDSITLDEQDVIYSNDFSR